MSDCLYFIEISRKTCAAIFRYQFCDVINFEIYLSFLTKPFSSMTKSSEQKTEISQEGKKLFRWNKNHFSSFLKDVQTWECTFKRQNQFSRLLPKHNIRGTNMHSHLYIANAETDIQWFSWKNIHALKLHPNVKVHAFGLIDALGLFSIIRFNNTLQNLWNSYSITTKVRVNASSYFPTCKHA